MNGKVAGILALIVGIYFGLVVMGDTKIDKSFWIAVAVFLVFTVIGLALLGGVAAGAWWTERQMEKGAEMAVKNRQMDALNLNALGDIMGALVRAIAALTAAQQRAALPPGIIGPLETQGDWLPALTRYDRPMLAEPDPEVWDVPATLGADLDADAEAD